MLGNRKITLQFSVNWLIAIVLLALALIAAFIFKPQWRTVLLFVAPVLGGSAALIAAFNALDSRVTQGLQAKKAISLDFIHRWLDPNFHHAKKNGRETCQYLKSHALEEQTKYLQDNPIYLSNLFDVLNLFEAMSIVIEAGMADEEIAKRFFRSLVLEYWHCSEGFMKHRRAERQNTRLHRELEWLFDRWKN